MNLFDFSNNFSVRMHSERAKAIFSASLSFILLLPTIGPYGFSDDYSNVFSEKSFIDIFASSLSQGRPILGILAYFQYSFIETYQDFTRFHVLSCLAMSALVYQLTQLIINLKIIKKLWISDWQIAIFVVFSCVALPSFQVLSLWMVQLVPVLSMVCGIYGVRILIEFPNYRRLFYGCILILISLFTYQTAFSFVMFLLLLSLCGSELIQNNERVATKKMLAILAIITTGVLINLFGMQVLKSEGTSRQIIDGDYQQKLNWILGEFFPGFFRYRPWDAYEAEVMFVLVIFFLLGIVFFIRHIRGVRAKVLLIMAIFVSMAPNLITGENWASNRSLMSVQWMAILFVSVALQKAFMLVMRVSSRLVIILPVALVGLSFYQVSSVAVDTWVNTQKLEIQLTSKELSEEDCKKGVYVKGSSWNDLKPDKVSFDEFGIPSTFPSWSTVPYAKFYCRSIGVLRDNLKFISLDEEVQEFEAETVIDFQKILNQ